MQLISNSILYHPNSNNDDFLHCTCEDMPISVQKHLALTESQVSYLRIFQYCLSGFFLTRSFADTFM